MNMFNKEHAPSLISSCVAVLILCFTLQSQAQVVTASDYSITPPFLSDSSDPLVVISLSVELTQQAEAFTGATQTYANGTFCPGRASGRSVCYSAGEEYIGYFDPDKCYAYKTRDGSTYDGSAFYDTDNITQQATGADLVNNRNTDIFEPVSTTTNHQCSGNLFSGNFMNWATMTALDEFRYAMTGGARLVDTIGSNAQTLLTRTHRYGDWGFVTKRISSTGITSSGGGQTVTFTNTPSNVTPFNVGTLEIINNNGNNGNRVLFRDGSGNNLAELSVIVETCNKSVGLEDNCVEYSDGSNTWYKPEGVLQQNAMNMRYALLTYSAQNGNARNGGVLRSNAKYINFLRPVANGGVEANPEAEINEFGQFTLHPDLGVLGGEDLGGVVNSGVINYINSFGLGPDRYKGNDPVSELYYESLRYIMGLDRTPEYADASGTLGALTNNQKDNFPVIRNWIDPVADSCQANYIVGVGDQFSHRDGDLPGTSRPSSAGQPSGAPSNGGDVGFNVTDITNNVGQLEGNNASLGVTGSTGRENTFYVAGMAHWAATNDIRNGQGGANNIDGEQNVRTFFVDTQEFNGNPPTRERNPLWMAAKYGGFIDANDDNDPNNGDTPTSSSDCGSSPEWDADGDCEPEAYTLASQPANLIAGLQNAFSEIANDLRAGSAAGVASNSAAGEALVVQALYKSEESTDTGDRVEWVGYLHGLFVDEFNNIREDTDGNAKLTNADNIIVYNTDPLTQELLISTHRPEEVTINNFNGDDIKVLQAGELVDDNLKIEGLNSVWSTVDELNSLTNMTVQRSYDQPASSGRYIFTSIDKDHDGLLSNNDVVDFTSDTFSNSVPGNENNFRYLGLQASTANTAENIVNFIRGEEIDGFRSRTLDYGNEGDDFRWLLGDIVTSTPTVVGTPDNRETYAILYGDDSYNEFANTYRNRRQVVYVGANDGMLHAINAGFYDFADQEYRLKLDGETEHPLGSELWAYVPSNVLPHLRWLTELSYPHVYYVDGIPQAFDVNIFPDSNTHPNGWGTILVVGLRFGGGDITIDPDSDTDADTGDDYTTHSSYIILDITNPEQKPTLLAEISHPQMGYTTTRPALVKSRQPDNDNVFQNEGWYLVFGSGPYGDDDISRNSALQFAQSNQTAKVFAFDLSNLSFVNFDDGAGNTFPYIELADEINGFTGDFIAADWDQDFKDDAVYFGTITGTVASPGGGLKQLSLNSGTNLLNINSGDITDVFSNTVDKPFSGLARPLTVNGENWLFTGSGRFYVPEDNLSTGQNSYYGIQAPQTNSPVDPTRMANVTDIRVQVQRDSNGVVIDTTNAAVFDTDGNANPAISVNGSSINISNFIELRAEIRKGPGWRIEFNSNLAKHVGKSDYASPSVGFTKYVSSGEVCDPLGDTFLNLAHFGTGTAAPFSATGSSTFIGANNSTETADREIEYAIGLVRDVSFESGRLISQGTQGDLGGFSVNSVAGDSGRVSWREIIINW